MTTTADAARMRPAVVKFRAPTALAVRGPQVFPSDSGRVVTATNWTERDEAGERHHGLVIDVALDAASPEDAVRRGLGSASATLALLSFGSSAAVGHLRPFVAYAQRDDDGCDVAQFDDWPLEPHARRMVKNEPMQALITKFNSLAEDDRGRVFRGLDWYRKALGETNVFDRFGAAWIGLEALNPRLRTRRGLPTTRQVTCKNCGAVTEVPDVTGAMDLVTRRFGEDEANHMRRFRQEFMHSTRPLNEVESDARRATKTAVEALRLGLLELLDVSADEEALLLQATPMRLPERNRVRYGYWMRPLRIATVPLGQACPRIGLKSFSSERSQDADGRTKEHIVHELELLDFRGGEIPQGLDLNIAIPSADPDDKARRFELSKFEVVSKETGEVMGEATITPIEPSTDPESGEAPPTNSGVPPAG
jgi:hypothetical protein